ncbi:MAG: TatD family hydrolase [Planctomycetota bacterium]
MITDSHAHLTWRSYGEDLGAVLARARAAGVERVIVPGTDVASSRAALALGAAAPAVFPAAGIHPHDAAGADAGARAEIEALCRQPECVAVGESGLDYAKEYSPRRAQLECFCWQLDLARRLDKPIIVHCRDAHADTARIVTEFAGIRGVMHCYAFGPAELAPYLEAGFLISFAGAVTYPGNEENREAARAVPADRLLVETDSPFLAPQAHRGRRNEPAYAAEILARIAEVRGEDPVALARFTSANATRLFALPEVGN